jgi:hypothetical protein
MKVENKFAAKLAGLALLLASPVAFGLVLMPSVASAEVTISTTIVESDDAGSEDESEVAEVAEEDDAPSVANETCEEVSESLTRLSRC